MLRNLSNSSTTTTTSADRREICSPSFPTPSAETFSKGLPSSSSSPYTKPAHNTKNPAHNTKNQNGFLSPTVKMGLMASFAVLFILVASSFAAEEYSDVGSGGGTPLAHLRGLGAESNPVGRMGGQMVVAKSALRAGASFSARSITEEGKASFGDELMGAAEDDGMANSDGTTLGSDLLTKMEQNLESNNKKDTGSTAIQRMLVYSGEISLKSPRGKVNEIADNISNLVSKDGYVEDRSESLRSTNWSREKNRKIIDMKLRVPSADFHQILDQIQSMVDKDRVISASSQSRDVTDEYIDASARADTLSASRDALKTILARANSIKDVMAVKTELGSMTEQIESLRRRAVYLKKRSVSYDVYIFMYAPLPFCGVLILTKFFCDDSIFAWLF